jgi:hypothetical protein
MSTSPEGTAAISPARVLALARLEAACSGYFDDGDIPDTGSFVGCVLRELIAREVLQPVTLELISSSLSLRDPPAGQSDFAALYSVRARLRSQATSSADGVTTIFGKTITLVRLQIHNWKPPIKPAFRSKVSAAARAQGITATASITLRQLSAEPSRAAGETMYAGWIATVMSSLVRHAAATSPSQNFTTMIQLLRPDSLPNNPRSSPDALLKAFTAPTWRTDPGQLIHQDDILLARDRIDLHFPPLHSEQSFRADLRDLGDYSGSYLILTDVHGLFSRSPHDIWPIGSSPLAERLRPLYDDYKNGGLSLKSFLRSAYAQRVALAQELRTTLLSIANRPEIKRASFTRGDGLAAVTSTRKYLKAALGPAADFRSMCLPFSVGACRIYATDTSEILLKRAEFALAITKLASENPERSLYVYGDPLSPRFSSMLRSQLARPVSCASDSEDKLTRLMERFRPMLMALALLGGNMAAISAVNRNERMS